MRYCRLTDKTNPFISMKKLSAVLDSFLILKNRRVKKTAWFLYQTVFVSCCRMADKFQLKFTLINLGFQILPVFLSITIL